VKPYYQDDAVTLYHGDCREILPTLGRFDLLLTDPPYGISWQGHRGSEREWNAIAGDETTDLAVWICSQVEEDQGAVIWGANNFPQALPHKGRWICWDKRLTKEADKMLGSAFELAWENKRSGFDAMLRVLHGGVVNADGGKRFHPTQKPVPLFRMVLGRYTNATTILDPFAGSGTTGVAAKLEGRKATLIELEERYCEIAAKRLSQGVLF
jgi:DNA modification methylase